MGAATCPGQVYERLYAFSNSFDANFLIAGNSPEAPLVLESSGSFLGTTGKDGAAGQGTVFRITPAGQLTTLADFSDGGFGRKSGLIADKDGNYHGTTYQGGAASQGTLFRFIPGSGLTTLHGFSAVTGNKPVGELVEGADGVLYGTTSSGGAGFGTVFIFTPEGVRKNLLEFDTSETKSGIHPEAGLLLGDDGDFYGTTSLGGLGFGTVFKMSPDGSNTTFFNLEGSDGANPQAALVQGADGTFYGTASEGGNHGHGTVFAMKSGGSLGALVHFTGNGGENRGSKPVVGLIQADDGNLYGTTLLGGTNGFGTVFKINTDGKLTTLFDFSESDGRPKAPLVAGADGALYGTTSGSPGVVYRIIMPGAPKLIARPPAAMDDRNAFLQTSVNPAGFPTSVFVQYGTDGIDFPNEGTLEGILSGDASQAVGIVVRNMLPQTTYFYRFVGKNESGTTVGDVQSFTTPDSLADLSSLIQVFPPGPVLPTGFSTTIIITPAGVGGWRYVGEPFWRASGVPAGANRSGTHIIEFRPVPGFVQPASETLLETNTNTTLFRNYVAIAPTEGGSLVVKLRPDGIASAGLPMADRAQWRLLGEDESGWRDSGSPVPGLAAGTHLIECKPVAGRLTPDPVAVSIKENEASSLDITYFSVDTSSGITPQPVPFASVSNDPSLPYAFVGQVTYDGGSGSGFAVNPRVIATAAQNVFNDVTLSALIGVKFLFRRDSAAHEPQPLPPRASFVLDDYASKRASENTPGTYGPASLDANVATIYYDDDIDGFSITRCGHLASDALDNPFLLSSADKTLVGYPVDGGAAAARGRMHASPLANVGFNLLFGRSYSTSGIRGGYGFAGAPLFVEHDFGDGTSAYFPAAIHVGSHNGQTVVRAIDSRVLELFEWARRDAFDGSGPPTPGATLVSLTGNLNTTEPGSLKVIIEPAAARDAGAGWSLSPETTIRQSGAQKNGLAPGMYNLELKTIPGFFPFTTQAATVNGGQVTELIYTYRALTPLDTWRFGNFGTYDNTGDAADGNDFDKDGESNVEEFTAGTNPKSGNDVFRMATNAKSGNTFTTTCPGKSGRTYTLMRNTGLSGSWTRLGSQGPLANDGTVTLSDTSAPPDKSFYRIEVALP